MRLRCRGGCLQNGTFSQRNADPLCRQKKYIRRRFPLSTSSPLTIASKQFSIPAFPDYFYLPEQTAAGYRGFDTKYAAASEYFHRSRFDRYILCQMAQNPFFAVFLNFPAVLRVVVFFKMRFIISPLVPVISVMKLSARTIPRSAAMALQ